MTDYYNENDPRAAAWLRALIAEGIIPQGDVDERSIVDVVPDELARYRRCHFFAGIGGWAYALKLAGWPNDRPVWTGSCPCQPFSAAGRGAGFADERHLWPAWHWLIEQCRPAVIFGEQVASASVVGKIVRQGSRQEISAGLQEETPSAGSHPTCGASSGKEGDFFRPAGTHRGNPGEDRRGALRSDRIAAEPRRWEDVGQPISRSHRPSERLRLLEHARGLPWREQRDGGLGGAEVGRDGKGHLGKEEAEIERLLKAFGRETEGGSARPWLDVVFDDLERAGYACGASVLPACGVGAPHIRQRLYWVADSGHGSSRKLRDIQGPARTDALAAPGEGRNGGDRGFAHSGATGRGGEADRASPLDSFWRDADWLGCRDGRWRPVKSSVLCVGDGLPGGLVPSSAFVPASSPLAQKQERRVMRLRGYGNAIVPQLAAAFVSSFVGAR